MNNLLLRAIQYLENLDKGSLLSMAVVLILLVGYLDYLTGFELSFSLFYLIPVAATAWFAGRRSAMVMALLSALVWAVSNRLAGEVNSHPLVALWNSMIRLGFFSIVALLLSYLRQGMQSETLLSRTDFLTGITNSRAFYEIASFELLRAARYKRAITAAYIDLDNFKQVNDRFGHSAGDGLLKVVAEMMTNSLRRTDTVARMGGDEFVVLLPETREAAARITLTKLQDALNEALARHGWEVTISMGAITFHTCPPTPDELLRQVDELMYAVKTSGKNGIRFARVGAPGN
jgi:diguanylate cyclase (GGDEF)-like protein